LNRFDTYSYNRQVTLTRRTLLVALVTVAFAGSARRASGQGSGLTVAAASDLQAVFPELARGFERASGIRVVAAFGSSGNFFAQIQNGAPFDVFMSADADYPLKLAASGHAERGSLLRYGVGHLVVWTRNGSGIDIGRGVQALTAANVRRIAIANPEYAPYGRAAIAALRNARIYDSVQSRLVLGENISQTAQLADSGNADVAIIALSLALGPTLRANGSYAGIPASLHPRLDQAAAVMVRSPKKKEARRFLTYLESREARATLQRFGFQPPEQQR
jgi:molybdate transport system substrate-binding protein